MQLGYKGRLGLLVILDSFIVLFSVFVVYYMLHPGMDVVYSMPKLWLTAVTLFISHHVFSFIYRLYKKAWEYASVGELMTITKAVTFSLIAASVVQVIVDQDIYVRVLGITWMLHLILIGGSRFSWRILRDRYIATGIKKKQTLIVGAGSAGRMIVRQLLKSPEAELEPVGFVDDNPRKYKLQIFGLEVKGCTKDIPKIVESLQIENIVIAIPSLTKGEIRRIYEECAKTKAKTKIMPLLEDLVSGKVSVSQIRDVEVGDLLGREPIELDMSSITNKLTGKTVLVTGAGGSIGSEICRQIAAFKPKKLLLLGHGENSIYQIDMELKNKFDDQFEIMPIIADIQDSERILDVMAQYVPDVVYHAAAHKHVPLMEYNPAEAVKNNIFGTRNVAEAAHMIGVKNFVLISTDKAVNPPNVMGATKRFAEMIIQNLAKESKTNFVAVRFGNVLGSRGSVIPLFKQQIQAGGPVTVTHPDMTRYFMTIPEASRLVIQAGALAKGGEVFVLDMGEPVKIVDLAKNLITLSGYTIDEIGITFSGLRPGEKLFEELLHENEVQKNQVFPKIFIGKAQTMDKDKLYSVIETLPDKDPVEMKKILVEIANMKFGETQLVKNV